MGAPALIAGQSDRILSFLNAARSWFITHVSDAVVTDGGTTQASGAGGALNFDADVAIVNDAIVKGVTHNLAAAADVDSDGGTQVTWTATSGESVVFQLVFETGSANDTPAYYAHAGSVATTGAQVAPLPAAITAALGHSNWTPVADVTVNRTGDTTVTVSVDHDAKGFPKFLEAFSETEAEFAAT